jgi:hypothetical protein
MVSEQSETSMAVFGVSIVQELLFARFLQQII